MKKTFIRFDENSIKPLKYGSVAFIRILHAQIYVSSKLAQIINIKVGDSLKLAYDQETDIIYISKTDSATGYKFRPHNKNPISKSGTIYIGDFLSHFNLQIKKNYRIDIRHIDKEKKEFWFEYQNGVDSIQTKKPPFFMKLSIQNKLYFSKSVVEAMGLKLNDIVSIFCNKITKTGYIKKNAPEDINGFVVKGSKKGGKEYIDSKLMQNIWGWPTLSGRITLMRNDKNEFYFEFKIHDE